ncbi:MAG TPA: hypothetical protein VJM76_08000 [Gammaproteobacteria bacterium]|nr:hypothetical protein [Gammaproteobacteria bacterium]
MSKATTLKGLLLATAAATLFSTASFSADKMAGAEANAEGKVRCDGVNSCKGKSDCMGENGCKGKNSCKGQGFLDMSKADCEAAQAKMKAEEAN